MIAPALKFPLPRLTRRAGLRMVAAGSAWGVLLSAGLTALSLYNCGGVCPDDVIATTAISIATGIVTVGPLAALGRSD